VSIRFKVILPYLLLTLVVAITGVYVVTRLVTNSLSERLTNQLLEAGRVVSDGMARQETLHIDNARIVSYTKGVAEALQGNDVKTLQEIILPTATGLHIENLILISRKGDEILDLIMQPDGSLKVTQAIGAAALPMVQDLLVANNPQSLPKRGLGINPLNSHYYYYSSLPVVLDNQVVGVIMLGTSLDTILPYLKSTSLADIVFYTEQGQTIGTTLGTQNTNAQFLSTLDISVASVQQIISTNDLVSGANFEVDGRGYSLARTTLQVGNDRIGLFGVVLPLNFVLQSGIVSRNTYVVLFTLAMVGVVLIGYLISRLIINPLSSLVRTSQAIALGDLNQRTGIKSQDEIGTLANTFDEMTTRLQERTIELERTNRILEQIDRTKGSFISIAAHELRTPLTLVKGYTQMLQMKANSDPELAPLSNGIADGTNRMMEIVNSMLDISKIDNKTLQVMPEKMQLSLTLERVHKTFEAALMERHITLEIQNLDSMPMIQADPDLLRKAFYHIIMNAIKYTPDGGHICVDARVLNDEPENPKVEVVVTDTGIGIAPQHHELIFEKFYQTGEVMLHSSGKTKFKGGGPGLGLAIARGIVEAHSGQIWVESSGCNETTFPGSKFYVKLPVGG
jgi:signal transduction histidine kinase